MTRERAHDWPSDRYPETAWRPDDYPRLAAEGSGSESGAASREASSGMTPEWEGVIARLRDRVVAQEDELLGLLDEFQHQGSEQATPQRPGAPALGNGRRPGEKRSRHDS